MAYAVPFQRYWPSSHGAVSDRRRSTTTPYAAKTGRSWSLIWCLIQNRRLAGLMASGYAGSHALLGTWIARADRRTLWQINQRHVLAA